MSFTSRRAGGLAGLSFIATTGLLGAYLGYPGLRKAQAATTCTVTTADDAGAGSLRQCLLDTASGTITFDPSVTDTIALSSDLPQVTLTSSLTITGNGTENTRINGRENSVFDFAGNHTVSISGLTVENGYVDNASLGGGGAIYSESGNVTITDSRFEGNDAYINGGAIHAKDGSVTITGSIFTSNSTYFSGGAISAESISVTNSTFTGNTSTTSGAGGALFTDGGAMTVNDSTFRNNSAYYRGGAIDAYRGEVTVTGSTFVGNSSSGDGGAIGTLLGSANIRVISSTFTGNSAVRGGAIFAQNAGSSVAVSFSTVSGNTTSGGSSGALHAVGSLSVTNSIVSNASGGDVQGASVTLSYSLLGTYAGTVPSSVIVGEDPLLGALADNGGPTQTMMPGAGSPVLGAANPAGAPATDQRGYTRTTNGRADMGAVERLGVPPTSDPSQVPPSWHQAQGRQQQESVCPPGMAPSWAQWPNEGTGGWTCEWTTWWDVNEGVGGGWVTTPGFRAGRIPGL